MRSIRTIFFSLLGALILSGSVRAQDAQQEWPRSFTTDDGTVVKIYQPQPESFSDNILKSRWAISVLQSGKTDPVFGTFWSVANVETDRDNRRVVIQSAKVPNVKFPGQTDDNFTNGLKTSLETNLPQAAGDLSLDESVSLFERGVHLSNACKAQLSSAESRIQVLLEPEEHGPVRVEELALTVADEESEDQDEEVDEE